MKYLALRTKLLVSLVTAIVLMAVVSCSDEEDCRETLTKAGYTEIECGGYAAFACGEDDDYATKFEATNPRGERVDGVVCCGILKNCTVRF